jgi:hypothetical protein
VALDPQDATPGFGWAIASTKAAAEAQALANCVATAGARSSYCKLAETSCDGAAQ